MKYKNLLSIVGILLLLLLVNCRNENTLFNITQQEKQQDEFFAKLSKSLSNNPDKDKIIERIKFENEKSNFLSKINKRQGEAKFENKILKQTVRKSTTGKDSDSIVYLNIPFGNDKYLTSVLFIEYSPTEFNAREIDNLKLKQLAYDESIDKQRREDLLMNYIILDKMQYDSDLYINIPSTLFQSIKKNDSALTKSFKIVNYTISSKSSPTGREGDIMICIEIEDQNCSCHGTHWECYVIGGGDTGNGDDGGTGGGTGTGNNGDNSGGGGGDGTGTGNGNPGDTDPCTDPNNPWYNHHSCGNSAPSNVINFIQKMNNYGFNIAGYLQFLIDNPLIQNGFNNYLNNNSNQTSASFINWGLDFLIQNPDITWSKFERIFFTPKSSEDGGENFDITKYSTIKLQKYPLPNFSSVNQQFPRDPNNPVYGMPSNQVYQLVGGNMYTQNINGNPNYQNACAIRVSRALNYAGQLVPIFFNDLGQQKSEKGNDTKNYILTAEAMLAYMLKAYPPPTYTYSGNDLKSVYNDIKGKNGIYIIIPNVRSELGASGHADIFYTNDCLVGGCHLGLPSGGSVYFWELKN